MIAVIQAQPYEWLWLIPLALILCVVAYGVDRMKH